MVTDGDIPAALVPPRKSWSLRRVRIGGGSRKAGASGRFPWRFGGSRVLECAGSRELRFDWKEQARSIVLTPRLRGVDRGTAGERQPPPQRSALEAVFKLSLEQGQSDLRLGVGLLKDRGGRLLHDRVASKVRRLGRYIHVADPALCGGQVFLGVQDAAQRTFHAVLLGTEVASGGVGEGDGGRRGSASKRLWRLPP